MNIKADVFRTRDAFFHRALADNDHEFERGKRRNLNWQYSPSRGKSRRNRYVRRTPRLVHVFSSRRVAR